MPIIEITNANFESEILKSNEPIILNFRGTGCTTCEYLAPEYLNLSDDEKYSRIKFCSVDVSQNKSVAIKMRVLFLPAFIIFNNGHEIKRFSGNNVNINDVENELAKII